MRKVKADNPEQAKRFAAFVRELEAAGELDIAEAEKRFEQNFQKMASQKPKDT